jgi:hypothetical protein
MLVGVSPVMAEELPARKPGLWQMTMAVTGAGPAGKPHPIEMSMCMDAKSDIQSQQMAAGAGAPKCSRKDMTRSGNTIVMDSVCDLGGTQSTSHSVITFTGDAAYHMEAKTSFNPPMAGQAEHVMTQDAKWTGACPAGMNPGDVMMPNGMKVSRGAPPRAP